jgi:hypothetical protein
VSHFQPFHQGREVYSFTAFHDRVIVIQYQTTIFQVFSPTFCYIISEFLLKCNPLELFSFLK